MPKADYFRTRYANAVLNNLASKAQYYKGRLEQMNEPLVKQVTAQQVDDLKARVASKSPVERISIAVKIIKDGERKGFAMQAVQGYLLNQCGLTMAEYLDALNQAGDGELLRSL